MPRTFSPPPRVSDPYMHHGTCVTHVIWCIPGSLTSGFLWSRRRGKRSRHSRCMHNPQFYASGKRPILKHVLTHWVRVTHVCVGKLTNTGSDNSLSPGRRQAFIWTNAGILLIWPKNKLQWNFNHTFSFKKIPLKMLSGKWRPFCFGLNVLNGRLYWCLVT